ncbi:RNI-like protein [Calocera cornea HHB12733]|uniref:RNI-like protein n=1 Tax=Calocera cornea HHB12733 TaxID=1353952 RepID=A0A165GGX9_9BASI|nr:RNI-like protein [Calocera cornea HHB12733]
MAPKRRLPQAHQRPAKRQRTLFVKIGQGNVDDRLNDAQRSAQQPSSSALSTRYTGPNMVPSLVRLSMLRFAQNAVKLSENAFHKSKMLEKLEYLPTHLVQPLFAFLRDYCPDRLSDEFISKYFLRGDQITFTPEMTGVLNATMTSIRKAENFAPRLKSLEIRGQPDLKDSYVAATISHLPSLTNLVLRGCTKVGSKSVEAAARTCRDLEYINLNYTIAGHVAIHKLLASCKKLHSIKLAGLSDITDTHLPEILLQAIGRLRRLKVRQTRLSSALAPSILRALSPDALSLDISFTSLVFTKLPETLEKLSLMATVIPPTSLPRLLEPLTKLRKLSLALLGNQAPNLSDDGLKRLLPILISCDNLVELNLASNTKLGLNGTGGISSMLEVLGGRLEVLNLSGIPRLRWYDLEPLKLMASPPRLRTLLLMNTGLDDEAADCIAACSHLQQLNLAGTGFSTGGVGSIVDACIQLAELDLTGCRGVRLQDRRRFFEAWSERKKHGDGNTSSD